MAPGHRYRRGRTVRCAIGIVPLVVILTLTGCVGGAGAGKPDATTAPSGGTTSTAKATSATPAVPSDDATAVPVPEAGANSQTAAISAAEKVVTAFGRPDLDYQTWINGLYPLLTQTGAAAYEDTDPANVPVHQVTGAGTILPGSTDVALIVTVPTDAGPYTVSLSRPASTAPWLADRIRPAQG